jgi:hypothetical protein
MHRAAETRLGVHHAGPRNHPPEKRAERSHDEGDQTRE